MNVSLSPSEDTERPGFSKGQGCRITSGNQRALGKELSLSREARNSSETHELPQFFSPRDQLMATLSAFGFYLREENVGRCDKTLNSRLPNHHLSQESPEFLHIRLPGRV